MSSTMETRGLHEAEGAFRERIGTACQATGATAVYSGRTATIYGDDADLAAAKSKMDERPATPTEG